MITLFHRAKTRSTRFIFLLEELGAPYRIQPVSTRTRDGTGAVDPANPHPHGKVPAISDDGEVVYESPAIALYLTDKYPQNQLGPRVGDPTRGAYLSWLCHYTGVFEPAIMCKFLHWEVPRVSPGWVPADEAVEAVIAQLRQGPYLLGERFSAVDILYGTSLAMFAGSPMIPQSELIASYAARVTARPAHARALALDETPRPGGGG